ncbi:YgzB family protein [Paenibacillus tarimensis]|uniref:YgzB family protein n=1 Tax=Paenibacillus tarimensis TaxID=416012 RepID=UPI001F27E4F3|nr:YgzB family protein [Paenibacillus tarimensis]MCF2945912.1 YgzB family protein [Paenibacillus tarimensis]
MFFKSAKINEFRLWGLVFTLLGMGLMIAGTAGIVFWGGQAGKIFAAVFMVIGMIAMLISVGIYFWAGMLSTSAIMLQCPECGKQTKMLGKTDRCMFCRTMLTLDPKAATEIPAEPAASAPDNAIDAADTAPSQSTPGR